MHHLNLHTRRLNSLTEPARVEQQGAQTYPISPILPIRINLKPRAPSSPASSQASGDDGPLYIGAKNFARRRSSLSPISNGSSRTSNRQSEPMSLRENVAWEMIDREISEWQNVCETGRPSWWSPVPRWNRVGDFSPTWQEEVHSLPSLRVMASERPHPLRQFEPVRRAVTDSYLADKSQVQELAQVIAVQLLGSCYTMPPDHMADSGSAGLQSLDAGGWHDMPDSRLISSLRMHTESRYAPAFGHQARNTSPATIGQGALDGTSTMASPHGSPEPSPQIEVSERTSRDRESCGTPNVTEASTESCQGSIGTEASDKQQAQVSTCETRRHKLGRIILPNREGPSVFGDRIANSWRQAPSPDCEKAARVPSRPPSSDELNNPIQKDLRGPPGASPNTRYSIRPTIRSEPHNLFTQPVRELVVKQWQTFRRRFGHSSSHGYPDPGSTLARFSVSTPPSHSSTSKSSPVYGSPRHSSDGKERRRRARERGDIHSSSIESNPHYSTPTGLDPMSPGGLGAHASRFAFADPLMTAATIASDPSSDKSSNIRGPSDKSLLTTQSTGKGSESRSKNRNRSSDQPPSSSKLGPSRLSPPSPKDKQPVHLQPSRRHHRNDSRKSQLSEMCTPDDCDEERNLLSALGRTLGTSSEEKTQEGVPGERKSYEAATHSKRKICVLSESQQGKLQRMDIMPLEETSTASETQIRIAQRPRMSRTSTSGTQLFTPSEDGVEVDGLPVGPTADAWDQEDKGKGKRTRSFLCLM